MKKSQLVVINSLNVALHTKQTETILIPDNTKKTLVYELFADTQPAQTNVMYRRHDDSELVTMTYTGNDVLVVAE